MPKVRAGEGEMPNVPSARVFRPHQARSTLLILLDADDFRFFLLDLFYLRMMKIPTFEIEMDEKGV